MQGQGCSRKVELMKVGTGLLASFTVGAALVVITAVTTMPAAAQVATKVSVWSGVYTEAQNKRGQEVHSGACAQCHGARLNGAAQSDQPPSPAIARAGFLRKWDGKTVAELFKYVREMMPTDRPGTLSDQDAIDSIAHMFAVSEAPAGDKELPPDPKALEGIVIGEKPKK
jgi:cytochrome c